MFADTLRQAEQGIFNALNERVIPALKRGTATPGKWRAGLVLLETRGRVSGKPFEVPVVATALGDYLLVGTVRRQSQWLRNAIANGTIEVWLGGRPQAAKVLGFPAASVSHATRNWGSGFALLKLEKA